MQHNLRAVVLNQCVLVVVDQLVSSSVTISNFLFAIYLINVPSACELKEIEK